MEIDEDDEVVDILDHNQMISRVKHSKKQVSSKNQKSKDLFKTNSDGRLVLGDDEEDDEKIQDLTEKKEISEDYYKKSLASEVSFTRGADGKVKFLKRKRQEEDVTFEQGQADKEVGKRWHSNGKKSKQDDSVDYNKMLGRQYKSTKARGDVKRAGMADPHAFIPLHGKIVGNM
jgi:ribosomal RNA-processing protein 12